MAGVPKDFLIQHTHQEETLVYPALDRLLVEEAERVRVLATLRS